MNETNWVKNLKVGDKVLTIEREFKWESTIVSLNDGYVETTYFRDHKNKELLEMCKNLIGNHRTFTQQWVKNYFSPVDGSINIEEIK